MSRVSISYHTAQGFFFPSVAILNPIWYLNSDHKCIKCYENFWYSFPAASWSFLLWNLGLENSYQTTLHDTSEERSLTTEQTTQVSRNLSVLKHLFHRKIPWRGKTRYLVLAETWIPNPLQAPLDYSSHCSLSIVPKGSQVQSTWAAWRLTGK